MPASMPCSTDQTAETVARWLETARSDSLFLRRTQFRHPFVRPATLSRGGMEVKAMCRDISPNGIGILQFDCVQKGAATVSLWLKKRVIQFSVDITWAEEVAEGWWASGGHLKVTASERRSLFMSRMRDDIERCIHRESPFFQPFWVTTCSGQSTLGWPQGNSRAFSLSVSQDRISLLTPAPFEPKHQTIWMQRNVNNEDEPAVRGRVVSCKELANEHFTIGVEFDTSLSP